ncbi:MAG: glycosyltransferase family 39 protein [Silvibacterium sp.]|nr:glycosyltransferase family 39 protein [Silvibacterium sp.]
MATILLILSFAIVANGFFRRDLGLREALIYATIPSSLFLVFTTEGLTVFHGLTKAAIGICWTLFALGAFVWMTSQHRAQPATDGFRIAWRELGRGDRWMLYLTGLVVILVGLTALLSPPNTWDAMEYHMPRVVEWITNRGVQLYPTIDRTQLSMPPFNEYVILHLQLMAGSDRFANMAQWLAYAGYILAVSLIVRELGGGIRAQALAAIFSATIPTGLLGASGTKNDCMVAYWIATSVFLLLKWKQRQNWILILAIASALSLAVFSKGTAYTFLPPLVLVCFFMWNWKAQKAFLWRIPIVALMCLVVSGPLWARNHAFSGSILGLPYCDGAGPVEGRMFGNGHITPARSMANVLRNIALNLTVPSERVNGMTTQAFSAAIRALGVDPNDEYQLLRGQSGRSIQFGLEWRLTSEIQDGNQIQFLLLIAAGVLCVWKRRSFDKSVFLLGIGIVGSFVLFATLLRWQPYDGRYQLPVFVVGAAFTATVLARVLPVWTTQAAAALPLLIALPVSVRNGIRPLVDRTASIVTTPREQIYFYDFHRQYTDSFIQAAKAARQNDCRSIGIDANLLHYEYPMMALVNEDGGQRQLSYVSVNNPTAAYKQTTVAEPCTVICLGCAQSQQKREEYQAQFQNVEPFGDILVFSDRTASSGTRHSAASETLKTRPDEP